jgi:hypothetical protein
MKICLLEDILKDAETLIKGLDRYGLPLEFLRCQTHAEFLETLRRLKPNDLEVALLDCVGPLQPAGADETDRRIIMRANLTEVCSQQPGALRIMHSRASELLEPFVVQKRAHFNLPKKMTPAFVSDRAETIVLFLLSHHFRRAAEEDPTLGSPSDVGDTDQYGEKPDKGKVVAAIVRAAWRCLTEDVRPSAGRKISSIVTAAALVGDLGVYNNQEFIDANPQGQLKRLLTWSAIPAEDADWFLNQLAVSPSSRAVRYCEMILWRLLRGTGYQPALLPLFLDREKRKAVEGGKASGITTPWNGSFLKAVNEASVKNLDEFVDWASTRKDELVSV